MVRSLNWRQTKGNVVLTVSIVLLVVTLVAVSIANYFNGAEAAVKKQDAVAVVQVMFDSIVWSIENDEAWKISMSNSPAANCLLINGTYCGPGKNNIDVYLEDGSLLVNGTMGGSSASNGFDSTGIACNTFNAAVPNNDCPFKAVVTWSPDCSPGCPATLLSALNNIPINPKIQMNVSLIYSGTDAQFLKINFAKRFNQQFIRGSLEGSLPSACRSSGGNFDPVTLKCQIQTVACAPDEILNGFDSQGNPLCKVNPFLGVGCGPGFAPVAVRAGGGLKCWKF